MVRHNHDFAEMFWFQAGRCEHWVNGERHLLKPNALCLILPGDCHSFRMVHKQDYRLINLVFRPETLRTLLDRYQMHADPFWGRAGGSHCPVVHLSPDQGNWLEHAFLELDQGQHSKMALDHLLLALMLKTARLAADPFAQCPAWLIETCRKMQTPEHLREGAKQFAVLSDRTLAYVSRLLRSITGKAPIEWVTEWRLAYAAEQLATTNVDILTLANECGFSSLGHFYALFKRRYGVPPREYRHQQHHALPESDEFRRNRTLFVPPSQRASDVNPP